MIPTHPAPSGRRAPFRLCPSDGSPAIDQPERLDDRHRPAKRTGSHAAASRPPRTSPSDQQLVALIRRGHEPAFDALAARYHTRLLSFCLRILRSKEDAEDALQDVFAAAFHAIRADEREIQLRPWLYRIARNRCLNQLRRATAVAVDSMDEHWAENGRTLVESVVARQEFRDLVRDVQGLPDTQRTALLLREIDGFSYQHIAAAMDTTVPSVKSLLVRARLDLLDSIADRDLTREAAGRTRARRRRGSRTISYQAAQAAASVARRQAA